MPAWVAMPESPRTPIPGVSYATLGQVGEIIAKLQLQHALMELPSWQWRPRVLLSLHHLGLRHCWGPWGVVRTRTLAYLRGGMILARRWWNRLRHSSAPEQTERCRRWYQSLPTPVRERRPGAQLRVVHYMRLCSLGGTERQVALLAGSQRKHGQAVRALAQMAALGETRTCHPWFVEQQVPLRIAGCQGIPLSSKKWTCAPHLLRQLPGELLDTVVDLLGELLAQPADVLHCWGDEANIAGLIAARLAGVPAVVMSSTGLSPHSYPATRQPWMQPWYQVGLRQSNTALACISDAGLDDYANWLEVPKERLRLMRIAVDQQQLPSRKTGLAWRQQQGISADVPVLVGLFRLEPGKRPLLFLEMVRQVKQAVPQLQVAVLGSGSLEPEVKATIARLGLQDTVRLLGQPPEVLTALAASDVMLLVSEAEGTPVSVLEAQLVGCVPVVTDVGGCRETVLDGVTGHLVAKDNLAEGVHLVTALFHEPERRHRMAAAGPAFVRERFSLERMTSEAEQIYQGLLGKFPSQARQAA